MYKTFCFLLVCITLGNALDRTMKITSAELKKGKADSGLTISSSNDGKYNITYNKGVSVLFNSLRVILHLNSTESNKSEHADIGNLCGIYRRGSLEEVFQTFTLSTLADVLSCPIEKGTQVSYSAPFDYPYKIERSIGCGQFTAQIQVFRNDILEPNPRPILTNSLKGEIDGC